MDRDEILRRVRDVLWYQTFELVPGVVTPGLSTRLEQRSPHFRIPDDLTGKRVLDIGCAEGYFTFLAESRGASVVSIDALPRRGFFVAREILGSKAEFHHMSVYDIHPDLLGMFDLVLFLGVYYHLKNPVRALERIATVTRDRAIIESAIMPPYTSEGQGACYFCEHEELNDDPTNWWLPTVPCLCQTVRAAGFPRVELVPSDDPTTRAIVHAYKGPRTAGKALSEDIHVQIDEPVAAAQVDGTVTVAGWTFDQINPRGIERVVVYLDQLDDPACELGTAEYGHDRGDLMTCFGDERYVATGYRFAWDTWGAARGEHALHVAAIGERSWNYRSVRVVLK